jgi:hypothetical protein
MLARLAVREHVSGVSHVTHEQHVTHQCSHVSHVTHEQRNITLLSPSSPKFQTPLNPDCRRSIRLQGARAF